MTHLLGLMFLYGKTRKGKNIKFLYGMSKHVMHLRKCCVPPPRGVILTLMWHVQWYARKCNFVIIPTRKHISRERKYTQNNFPSNPNWYDKECESLKYVVNNIAKHRDFNAQQGEYNILLRQYKQFIQRKKRQYQQAKLSELENMRAEDPNSYWKFCKSLNPRNVTTGPTLADFVNYFEQQIYPPHVDYFAYKHMNNIIKQVTSFQHNVEHDNSNKTQFLNSPITAEEIKKAIQKSKCKKAAGVDGISAEFYKYGCNELLPALELLFNTILTNGEYPSRWAIIHPVHKKGAHGVPDN